MQNWLERSAHLRPDGAALELVGDSGTLISYAQLLLRARAGARAAPTDGRFSGTKAALEGSDPLCFAEQLHATLLNGAVAMPIDPRLTDAEREHRERTEFAPPPGAVTMMFTSGTTSDPKPVYLTAGNWEANAIGSALALGLDQRERWLCTMPLAHVGGLSILLRSTLYATTVVLHDGFKTEAVLNELMDPGRRITLVSLVPTMLSRLLDAGLKHPPTLRWVLLGGGPMAPALLQRAQQAGVPVAPSYGMTETCSQLATFGFPLYGAEIRFEQDGVEADSGEVVVRGPSVAPLSLDADGWLRTGDVGGLDDRGRLFIAGRKSDTIISGGENISPTEVEHVLCAHPAVADAGVHAVPDAEWGEAVVAKVVLRAGETASPQELIDFTKARLAGFKVPKQLSFVDGLPRTASGKLLRRRL